MSEDSTTPTRTSHGPGRRRGAEELHALADDAAARFADADPAEVLGWAGETLVMR